MLGSARNPNNIKYSVFQVFAFFALCFLECIFMRNVLMTGNGALFGDRGDGRLTTLLTEHWWNYITGKENFFELSFFYPAKNVMGYTDLFLGYGVIHVVLRFCGLNMWNSYKWTLIIIHIMGIFSMYYLLHRKLKCDFTWSMFGTISFSFSNAYALHFSHTQLNSISFLPVLFLFFWGYIQNYNNRVKKNIYALLFIVGFVLLTYTSWYVACFSGLFCLIYVLVLLLVLIINDVKFKSFIKSFIFDNWLELIIYALFTLVLYIPFIKIYLPAMGQTSGYDYKMITEFMPEPADIINVGRDNVFFGWAISRMGYDSRGYSNEVQMGYSVILLLMFIIACCYMFRKHRGNNVLMAAIITVLVCICSVMRLSSNGISLWWFIYTFIPIVRSMRAVGRFLLWLSFPISLITAIVLNCNMKNKKKRIKLYSWLLILFIFISNLRFDGVSSSWDWISENGFINNVLSPPSDMEVFYIIDTKDDSLSDELPTNSNNQIDAYEIANQYNVKTINGYSGNEPEGWHGIWDIYSDEYENSAYYWIKQYDLKNVYAYDRTTNEWIPFETRCAQMITDVFCPLDSKYSINSGLNGCVPGEYIWTSQEFYTTIKNERIQKNGLVIRFSTRLKDYKQQNPDIEPYIDIYVDDELISREDVVDGDMELRYMMLEHDSDEYKITIKTNCYFNPKELGQSNDGRNLSLALYYIGD